MSKLCEDCDISEDTLCSESDTEDHPFYDDPLEANIKYPNPNDYKTIFPASYIDSSAYIYDSANQTPEEMILGTSQGLTGDDRFYNINKKRSQMSLDSFHMFKQNYRKGMQKWHESELADNIESRNNWLNDYFPDLD